MRPMTQRSECTGVLPVDKPEGPTSHDVVAQARRALGERRIGHTGTLDPFASGLLLLCIGRATRLAEYLTGLPKAYRATLRLGVATATDDRMGAATAWSDAWRVLDESAVTAALYAELGVRPQRPPAYSAKKIEGERAYRRARRGESPDIAAVDVEVRDIRLVSCALPEVTFDVECSSGTYIRAIARDVGERLGTHAHLVALRRTAIGRHQVADALPLARIDDAEAVRAALLSPLEALADAPRIELDADQARAVTHGRALETGAAPERDVVLLVHDDTLVAVARARGGRLEPRKVFA